jgi:hypothetical protein
VRRFIKGTAFLIVSLAIFLAGIGVGFRLAPRQAQNSPQENQAAQGGRRAKTSSTAKRDKQGERLPKKKGDSSQAQDPPKPAAQVTFATHIRPIFRAKCISCHGGRKTKGDLDLRTVAALFEGGDSGPGIKAGDVEASVLWTYIVNDKMPPGKKKKKKKLTAREKQLIRAWILSPKQ